MRFILTGGQAHEAPWALKLIEGFKAQALLADRAYDTNTIVQTVQRKNTQVVIPPKAHRKVRRDYNKTRYKQRNLIERMFNRLKNWRRIATRYDKTSLSFISFLHVAGSLMWLR